MHRDGHPVWVHDEAVLLRRRKDGRPWLFQGAMYDISERVAADAALRESLDRFTTLATHAPMGIFQTDAAGRCVYVNDMWCEIAGMPVGQALGDGWAEALHPDDRAWVYEEWTRAAASNDGFAAEYRFLRPSGEVRWVIGSAVALRDASGSVTGHLGTIADITARRAAEEELRLESAAVEATTQGILITSVVPGAQEARIVFANPAFTTQTGYSFEEIRGRSSTIFLGPDTDADVVRRLWETLDAGLPFDGELLTYRRDGSSYIRELTVGPIRDAEGRITNWISVSRDVTKMREAERLVSESLEALRTADAQNRAKLVQLVESQEQELGRMAEGVEDRSLQEMTAVRLRLDMLKKSLSDPTQLAALDQFGRSVEHAVGRLRGLVAELRPRELGTDGLTPAIEEYLSRAAEGLGLEDWHLEGSLTREPGDRQRAAAFRVVQDLVAAAVADSAREVRIVVADRRTSLSIFVSYTGSGGEPSEGSAIATRERAELAGGWLEERRSAEATTFELLMPFEDAPLS